MKKIFVTGNVGRDPETRYAPSGESFVTFSLAVSSGTKANPRTDWMEISCNGKTAEVVQNYVRKGTKLLIEGIPSVNAYINKEGKAVGTMRVTASTIEFIGSRERAEDADGFEHNSPDYGMDAPAPSAAPKAPAGFNAPGPSLQPDDIPF